MIADQWLVAWRVGEREAQEGRFTKGHRNLSVTNISTGIVKGWVVSLQNSYEVLTPGTSECELTWKWESLKMHLVKLRWGHAGIEWAHNPVRLVSLQKECHKKRDRQREDAVKTHRRLCTGHGMPKSAGKPPGARREVWNRLPFRSLRRKQPGYCCLTWGIF